MTFAICIKCGAGKLGALTPCRECGFEPTSPEDQAKGIALSDHSMSGVELSAIATKIKGGEEISFDEAWLGEMVETIRQNPTLKMPIGCVIAVWTPIVIMIVLAIIVVVLLIYTKANAP